MESFLQIYCLNGGPLMFVLAPMAVVAAAAIFQGMIRFRRQRVLPGRLLRDGLRCSTAAERSEFMRALAADSSPLAQALLVVLRRLKGREQPPTPETVDQWIGEAVADAGDDMHNDLALLGLLYTTAPLAGLVGTILGMMNAFREFAMPQNRAVGYLSLGFQQALITTLWGLLIALFSFAAAMLLQSRIRRYERKDLPREIRRLVHAWLESASAPSDDRAAISARGTTEFVGGQTETGL